MLTELCADHDAEASTALEDAIHLYLTLDNSKEILAEINDASINSYEEDIDIEALVGDNVEETAD